MRIGLPKDVSADGAVFAGNGAVQAVVLTPAAAVSTLVLYDNASAASGTVLLRLQAAANGGSVSYDGPALPFQNGVYADIGGAGAAATVVI